MTREHKWMIVYYILIFGATISFMFSAPSSIFWLFNISAFIIVVTGYIKRIKGTW